MGRKRKVSDPGGKFLSDSTRLGLERIERANQEAKAIEVRSGKLSGIFCHYEYLHTVAENTKNKIGVKSEVPMHEDLPRAFSKLNVHLAVVCEEIRPDEIPDIDDLPVWDADPDLTESDQDPLAVRLNRFHVTAFQISGTGENEGVILTGSKRLSTGELVSLQTPVVRWKSEYAFTNELHIAVFDLVTEIEEYNSGKQAPQRQMEMDFGGFEDGEDL
ncbi:hypothetical protein DCC81_12090 [Chitinophaga parva]|uniref:Uncharacterized protein n=1 Tax=Chitinophaga parva TaxID=2169414 RepID=A0A2T7BFI5_9BACT|nr:hypothetical protein [Chitinophaga parva]PUZ25047.1 hypothetical protein DCC81_12090 [Chitinophaga parva]